MKVILKVLATLVAVMLVWFIAQMVASETGEVVVLTTTDSSGETLQTRLWVFDHEGKQYLRSGDTGSGWYNRLLSNPAVSVTRNDVSNSYTAIPSPELRDLGNQLLREKYGWRDAYIEWVFGRDTAIPIRLEPAI